MGQQIDRAALEKAKKEIEALLPSKSKLATALTELKKVKAKEESLFKSLKKSPE